MSEHYFQFPISALSYGLQTDPHWEDVVNYASLDYGVKALKSTPAHVVDATLQQYLVDHKDTKADLKHPEQRALIFGFSRLGVNAPGNIVSKLERAWAARDYCSVAPYPLVRIRTDFWWKTFAPEQFDHPISYREFAVLCAVYAAIGSKPYAKLTHKYLRCLASGYTKWCNFIWNQNNGNPDSLFLSARQIRTTLDALEANGFFAKFTYNRGECFYSHKLNRSELIAKVENRKLRKLETVATYRSLDQVTSKGIKARKEAAASPLRLIA